MKPLDIDRLADALIGGAKRYIDTVIASFSERLTVLEQRQAAPSTDDMQRMIDEAVSKAVAQYVTENPPPAGKDGADGAPGERGADGKDGADGRDGVDGKDGADGTPGRDGIDGKDGVGLADAVIDHKGALVLTMSDGRTKELGVVIGKNGADGAPGKDGRDGFSLEDFDAEVMDDGRTVRLKFDKGDYAYSVELGFPVMIYRGVYEAGREYERGDTVTWGGSLWHCDAKSTTAKPDSSEKHWTLAAKKGRDGREPARAA